MSQVQLNKKYKSLYNSDARYHVVTGGRGSGKSFGINVFLLHLTYEKGHKILFTRYTMTSASMSIIPEFLEKIDLMGVAEHFDVTKAEITNKLTGSSIIFSGVKTSSGDQTAKLKSINAVTTFVVDEAEELTDEEVFDKIDFSVRAKGVKNRCIVILNPTTKEHWIYQRFFQNRGVPDGHNGDKENVNYIHTTYLDNIENLSESFVLGLKDMQRNRPEKFRHQIMGGWLDRAEGVVFTDWSIGDFPKDMDTIFGQDFGFSVDPSVLVEVAVDKKLKKVWAKLHFYKPGMATSQLYESNRRYAGKNLIVCDNSEPRLLSEFKMKGLNVTPTIKKKGSILTGIAMMQDYHIVIDSNSIDLIKEFNNYSWKMKGSVPRDDWNHGIDALRYACEYLLMRSVPKGMYIVN